MFTKADAMLDERRKLMKAAGAAMLLSVTPLAAWAARQANMLAVRIWPANDYTRVTLELNAPIKHSHFVVESPNRLVVDLEGLELNRILENLADRVSADDPYIRMLRAGQYRPDTVRVVMELKTKVVPQVFELKPIGNYGHRLVLDLYPNDGSDSLFAFASNGGFSDFPNSPNVTATPSPSQNQLAQERQLALQQMQQGGMTASPPPSTHAQNDDWRWQAWSRDDPAPAPRPWSGASANRASNFVVALDPGHGGEDPGAIGRNGTQEKHVTLAIARRLRSRLEAEGLRVILTRDADYFVPLHMRVHKARSARADLFISIHADAWIKPDARGSSVFTLSNKGATSTAAQWLAQKENDADMIGGINISKSRDPLLARTLLDLSQTATSIDSSKVARSVLNELAGVNQLHKEQVEQAGFAVLKAPDIPSILIETAFISNPIEEQQLASDFYQDRLAEAIQRGVRNYSSKLAAMRRSKLSMLP